MEICVDGGEVMERWGRGDGVWKWMEGMNGNVGNGNGWENR